MHEKKLTFSKHPSVHFFITLHFMCEISKIIINEQMKIEIFILTNCKF